MSLPLGGEDAHTTGSGDQLTVVHFVETSPSVLREMPWITLKEHKVSPSSSLPLFLPLFLPTSRLPFLQHSLLLLCLQLILLCCRMLGQR